MRIGIRMSTGRESKAPREEEAVFPVAVKGAISPKRHRGSTIVSEENR
jgi:hypothetical protein